MSLAVVHSLTLWYNFVHIQSRRPCSLEDHRVAVMASFEKEEKSYYTLSVDLMWAISPY